MDAPDTRGSKKHTVNGKRFVIVAGTTSIVALFAVTFAFRTLGWTRFIGNANLQEGKDNVVYISRAVSACAERTGALPPSSGKVPPELSQIAAKTYASSEADWKDQAFACEGFHVRGPQRFQYEWEKTSDTTGVARARGDFNGDGVVEATFEQDVACIVRYGKLRCGPGSFHDRAK